MKKHRTLTSIMAIIGMALLLFTALPGCSGGGGGGASASSPTTTTDNPEPEPAQYGVVTGAVTARQTRSTPIEGAKVNLANQTDYTDSNGTYVFNRAPVGTHTLTVEVEGFQTITSQVTVNGDATTTANVEMTETAEQPPEPDAVLLTVTGNVKKKDSPYNIKDAVVEISQKQGVTGEDGNFTVPDAPEGEREVKVNAAGFYQFTAIINIIQGQPNAFDFLLTPVTYNHSLTFGGNGRDNGKFLNPNGAVVDSQGNLYVVDTFNNRVQKFDSDGNHMLNLDPGVPPLNGPAYIAVDSDDNVYVTDYGNDCIQKFNSNGQHLLTWGEEGSGDGRLNGPIGIAVHNGEVFVSERLNFRVQVFDAQGNYLRQWGERGNEVHQLTDPGPLGVDKNGNVYVADEMVGTVKVFTSQGVFIKGVTGGADPVSWFGFIYDVKVDNEGCLYVVDAFAHRVVKLDPNQVYLETIGSQGFEDGQFMSPTGVAVSSNGDVYVVDYGNNRVQKFIPAPSP